MADVSGPTSFEFGLEPTTDPAWFLVDRRCDPLRQSSRETRFAISNGFLGVRGSQALNPGAGTGIQPHTYVAGLFDTSSAEGSLPGLVHVADWLQVRILLRGCSLAHHADELSLHRLTLDMRRGAFLTECGQPNAPPLGVRLRTLRLVSLHQRALGLQMVELEIEDPEIEVEFEASFEGLSTGLVSERLEQDLAVWRTERSGKRLAIAASSSLQMDGQELTPEAKGPFRWVWNWTSKRGQIACFQRIVAIRRSDRADLDPGPEARGTLEYARHLGWRDVLSNHEAAWARRWRDSDVEIEGDADAQQALRFAIYQLNSAANPDDEHVSIGARGLTGDDYRGHVFWDTEIFLLPFYSLTWPEAARTLLMYRFFTLDAARKKAARMGWRGALYAWESADTGDETTPEQVIGPDRKVIEVWSGRQEQHISADVAYAVWQYWQASGDVGFFLAAGAEILLETGRFWASRAQPEADGYCHIRGVIGPDEYHENIDDNAFTNVMARWNIRQALDVVALLRARWPERWSQLASHLGLSDMEMTEWRTTADTIATGLNPETGIFEQFAGFFSLEDINLADYAGRSVPMDVVLGRERTQRSQVVKQADVVALLCLLPEEFHGQSAGDNFHYYESRCGHGSSLSRSMHGLTAARLGYCDMALQFFQQTAAIDLADTHVAIAGGVHIASQGGIWLMAVFGFAGLSLLTDGIAINPQLPKAWLSLCFRVQWRGQCLKIKLEQANGLVECWLEAGEPISLVVRGQRHELHVSRPLHLVTRPAAKPDQGLESKNAS
ncbi:glycosyl hydrolase family 65 protein [Roseiarcaceae bacterium H3SJ34-1]|uniref:glycoside hydrolase family 65 protein n=1 Tax=Terripilifer ovatus TaxID=3032367 RepID=UPI003AB99E37|nr:glycosyl hydrolase family 65 protein [Roseiarcaceae bacterium H3SJ34-1]